MAVANMRLLIMNNERFDIDQNRETLVKSHYVSYTDLLSVIDDLPEYAQELKDNLEDDPEDTDEDWLAANATAYGPEGPMGKYLALVAGFYADSEGIYFDPLRLTAVQAVITLVDREYYEMGPGKKREDFIIWTHLGLSGDDDVDYSSGHLNVALDFVTAWCERNFPFANFPSVCYLTHSILHRSKMEKA